MATSEMNHRLLRLSCRWIDGAATPEEVNDLDQMLRESEECRREYLRFMRCHGRLALMGHQELSATSIGFDSWEAGVSRYPEVSEREPVLRTQPAGRDLSQPNNWLDMDRPFFRMPSGRLSRWLAGTLVGVVLLFAGLSLLPKPASQEHGAWIQLLSASPEALEDLRLSIGSRNWKQDLQIQRGEISLGLDSGVTLYLHGPTSVAFQDSLDVRLHYGKVTGDVSERGHGFTMRTAQAEIVDRGTRFGVESLTGTHTDVVVIEGAVELYEVGVKKAANAPVVATLLEQGDGVRVRSAGPPERISTIIGGERFNDWSTHLPSGDCTVLWMHDNHRAPVKFSYRIIPHGMQQGALVYTDRDHVYAEGVDGEFPDFLKGADLIQAIGQYRRREDLTVHMAIGAPSTVYILMVSNSTPPEWLVRDFVDTGLTIGVNKFPPDPNTEQTYFPWSIWKREVSDPGVVTLGPTGLEVDGKKWPTAMYGIAVQAQ